MLKMRNLGFFLLRSLHHSPYWARCCLDLFLALDMEAYDYFPELNNMALSQKSITILNFPFLFCYEKCFIVVLLSSSIVSISSQFQFRLSGHVGLNVPLPYSILSPPRPTSMEAWKRLLLINPM